MKKTAIRKISKKREEQLKEYRELKEEKIKYYQTKGPIRCCFCNGVIDLEEKETYGFHHWSGRDNDNLTEFLNIDPAHNLCHGDFHHLDFAQLKSRKWYFYFLDRLKRGAGNNSYKREAYNQELRRQQKAGVLDHEQYLKLYIDED